MAQQTVKVLSRTLMQLAKAVPALHSPAPVVSLMIKESRPDLKMSLSSSSSRSPGTSPKKILGLSSILLQDGLDIEEMPVIIRRTDRSFLFDGECPTEEQVRPASEEDVNFKHNLQNCCSVKEVLALLDIPGDKVSGYSAAFALQRICQLGYNQADDLHSFVRTAILNELYDTVIREVSALTNDTLISMVQCYVHNPSYNHNCMVAVKEEVEKRIGNGTLSLKELCTLSDTLHTARTLDKELVQNIWVHVGSRYNEIDESNVSRVCCSLPLSYRYIAKLVEKQSKQWWWKLTGPDVASVLTSMVVLRNAPTQLLNDVGKWLFLNIHSTTENELMQIVTAFIVFRHSDARFIQSVERYVTAKGVKLDANLLALVMEYCRSRRFLSSRIFDVAALHFTQCFKDYQPVHVSLILRPFGHLNYLPPNAIDMLMQVEKVLVEQFHELSIPQLSELLCSFACLGKVPRNFVSQVLTPSFLSKVKQIPDQKVRHQVGLWLEMYQSAVLLETRGAHVPLLFKVDQAATLRDNRVHMTMRLVRSLLEEMLGPDTVAINKFAPNTVYAIDLLIRVDANGEVLTESECADNAGVKRLALLLLLPEHFCVNTGHLMGEHAMRSRHLRILGYEVIEILAEKMNTLSSKGGARKTFLKQKLAKYINFE